MVAAAGGSSRSSGPAAALEVLLCSGFPTQIVIITVLSAFGMKVRLADGASPPFVFALTLLDTLLLVGLILFFLRAHRESVREQLFGRRPHAREILFGLVLIPASFCVVIAVLMLVQLVVPSLRNVPHNPLQDLVRNRVGRGDLRVRRDGRRRRARGDPARLRAAPLRAVSRRRRRRAWSSSARSSAWATSNRGATSRSPRPSLGAFWGAIFLRRRSIAGPMVGHAGFNLAQVIKFLTSE